MRNTLLVTFCADGILPTWSVYRDPQNQILLCLDNQTHILTQDATICWQFGGLSAAVGEIPIAAEIRLPTATISLGNSSILEEWGDEDPTKIPEVVLQRLLDAFAIIQEATDCAIRKH